MKEIKIHDNATASIKDLSKDLDISDIYWNNLFKSLTALFDNVYFLGFRCWVREEDLDKTIEYLSEEILVDKGNGHADILFRLKISCLMRNRRLVSKMWDYYEFPGFVFLGDSEDEDRLLWAYKNHMFAKEIAEQVDNILIMHREAEFDVLWIHSNIDLKKIMSFL